MVVPLHRRKKSGNLSVFLGSLDIYILFGFCSCSFCVI